MFFLQEKFFKLSLIVVMCFMLMSCSKKPKEETKTQTKPVTEQEIMEITEDTTKKRIDEAAKKATIEIQQQMQETIADIVLDEENRELTTE